MNNLSEKEKKAIDYLQLCYDLSTITNESLPKLGIVLNLIEKQSKEIEELKDKIKAKIEELEKEQEDNRKRLYNAVNNLCFKEIDKISNKICVNMTVRDILQSLLKEEKK